MGADEGRREAVALARPILANAASQDEVWRRTVDAVEQILPVDACEVLVARAGTLHLEATSGLDTADSSAGSVIAEDLAEETYDSREAVSIGDGARTDRVDVAHGYRSILSVPLGSYGVLQAAAAAPGAFDEQVLALADLVGGYAVRVLNDLSSDTLPNLTLQQTRRVVELADVMLLGLDTTGRVTFANRTARELLVFPDPSAFPGVPRVALRNDADGEDPLVERVRELARPN